MNMSNERKEFLILVIGIYAVLTMTIVLVVIVAKGEYKKGYIDGLKVADQSEYGAGVNVVVDINYTIPQMQEEKIAEPVVNVIEKKSLGKFTLTAYCPCEKCCGVNTGITATGTKATQGRTIGVDPSVIPYGSVVEINGVEYVAEDTGNIHGNHIDIYFDSHDDAVAFGSKKAEVFLIEGVE